MLVTLNCGVSEGCHRRSRKASSENCDRWLAWLINFYLIADINIDWWEILSTCFVRATTDNVQKKVLALYLPVACPYEMRKVGSVITQDHECLRIFKESCELSVDLCVPVWSSSWSNLTHALKLLQKTAPKNIKYKVQLEYRIRYTTRSRRAFFLDYFIYIHA